MAVARVRALTRCSSNSLIDTQFVEMAVARVRALTQSLIQRAEWLLFSVEMAVARVRALTHCYKIICCVARHSRNGGCPS